MRFASKRDKRIVIGIVIACLLLSTVTALAAKKTEEEELVWPLPPEKPRIKFVKILSSSDDYASGLVIWFRKVILGEGSAENKLDRPFSVAVNSQGRIYVTDNGKAPCVIVFDEGAEKKKVWRFGDSGRFALVSPIDVTVNENAKLVYVSDSILKKVAAFDFDGNFKFLLDPEVEFANPTGLAYDRVRDKLYVVDTKEHNIKVFTGDGQYLSTIGKRGSAPGEFNFPSLVDLDSKGNLYVSDSMNFRVQVFDPEGNFLRTFGSVGDGPGQFSRAKGIALDSEDHVYVVDGAFNNFQIFTSDGQLLMWVG
ncbi:MAG: 6-bladed beta-propeller, partial [Firmicutes bacterium]|nr:6-bladed beta-propeller [Bacillota bacterium]